MSARLAEVLYFYAPPNDAVMCDGASLEWLKQGTAEAFNIQAAEAEILPGGSELPRGGAVTRARLIRVNCGRPR